MASYNEETELKRYVIQWCRELMTELENNVVVCSQLTPESLASTEPLTRKKVEGLGYNPATRAVLELGVEEARQWVVDQVLDREGDKLSINRCPSCQRILRSPEARQCLWCGHDWH